MADKDDIREGKDFGIGIPQANKPFHVKGAGALDWGMQNRLAAKKLAEEKARARTLARAQAVAEKLSTATEQVASAIAEASNSYVPDATSCYPSVTPVRAWIRKRSLTSSSLSLRRKRRAKALGSAWPRFTAS